MSLSIRRGAYGKSFWTRFRHHLTPLAATTVLVSCQPAPESTLERVHREGFVRAGYSQEPPYAFFDAATAHIGGESPESLRAVVDELGIEGIRWVRLDFGDLIPALLMGRVDVIAAGMYRTPEREEQVRFSIPTLCSEAALIVPSRSPVTSIEDVLRDSTLQLAVLHESVEHSAATEMGIHEEQLVTVPDLATGAVAVYEGSASAFAVTLPTAHEAVQNLAANSLEIRQYDPPPSINAVLAGCSALAFRPQDGELIDAVDDVLSTYVGSRRHLAVLQLLGFRGENLPPAGDYR